jgi:hypothetical protein
LRWSRAILHFTGGNDAGAVGCKTHKFCEGYLCLGFTRTVKCDLIVQNVTCEATRSYQTVSCLPLDVVDICIFKGPNRSFFIIQNSETLKYAITSSPKLQKPSMKMKLCLSTGVNWTCHNEGSQFFVTAKTLIKPRSLECQHVRYISI